MGAVTRTLGEICDEVGGIIRTGPFGSQLHQSDYVSDGVPVVMPKDIREGKISSESIAQINEDNAKRLAQHRLKAGDIVYGRRGDIGRQAIITEREAGWLCGTGCLRLSLGERVIDPTFLHYYLRDHSVIKWIANQAIGATLPNLNTSILRSVPVKYPDLRAQREIAGVLSAYDELIENNTRRIKILEKMAHSIYREWFVHFRFPGREVVKSVDSRLGEVPEGWEVKKVTEAVSVNPRTPVQRETEKAHVSMDSLATNSMLIGDVSLRTGNNGSKFKNADTLFARITPCLENGKTAFVQFLSSDSDVAIGSTEFIVLRSKTLCPEYVYLMARSNEFRDNAIKSMSGATGRQRVQEECFEKFLIAQPDGETLRSFQEITKPMFKLILNLAMRNANLRRTRDLLLPGLLSGEIAV